MEFVLRFTLTDVSAVKIDWLMELGSKSKCDVSAGNLNSGKSENSSSILSTSFRITYRYQFHFLARILYTDLCHFHSSLNHFQQTSEKRKQST